MIKKFDTFVNEGLVNPNKPVQSKHHFRMEKSKIDEITEAMPLLYELLDKVNDEYKGNYFIIYKDVPGKDYIEPFVCAHKRNKLVVLSDSIDILKLKGNTDKLVKDIANSAKKNDINGYLSYNPDGGVEEEEE